MDKALLREFILKLSQLNGKEYLMSTIAYGAAPTIKGIKPASLISFSTKGRNSYELWETHKYEICMSLGLQFFELRESAEQRLVLFYNLEMLRKHIFSAENRSFLVSMGYDPALTLEQSLQLLKSRFEDICAHEIGIFLGIPVEDVCGFIEHRGEKCMFCSYWKVYHNPEGARRLFRCYDKAKISIIYSIMNVNLLGKTAAEAS